METSRLKVLFKRVTTIVLAVVAICFLDVNKAPWSHFGVSTAWAQGASSGQEAAQIAQSQVGGKVLSVNLIKGPKPHYRVKLIKKGRVKIVRIPAQ